MKNVNKKKNRRGWILNASNSLKNIKIQNTVTTFTRLLNFLCPESFRVSITIKRMKDRKKGRRLKIAGLSYWSIIIDLLCYSLLQLFHHMLVFFWGGCFVLLFSTAFTVCYKSQNVESKISQTSKESKITKKYASCCGFKWCLKARIKFKYIKTCIFQVYLHKYKCPLQGMPGVFCC